MRKTTTSHNSLEKSSAFEYAQTHRAPSSPEWTVFTVDWDVESLLKQLQIRSAGQSNARFVWKAPDSNTSKGEEFVALGRYQALKATGERRFHGEIQAKEKVEAPLHYRGPLPEA